MYGNNKNLRQVFPGVEVQDLIEGGELLLQTCLVGRSFHTRTTRFPIGRGTFGYGTHWVARTFYIATLMELDPWS